MLVNTKDVKKNLSGFTGWKIESEQISKVFLFPSFEKAIAFVNKVATLAEKADHHPDIDIRYNKVSITLSTHDEGGITKKDIDLAKKLEKIK